MRTVLRFLGRHARWALPAGVFAGIVLPELAALLRPLLAWLVIGTLTTALLRLNWGRFAQAAAPPIGSAAVFALILGLDGVLAVVATMATTLLLPLTLTPLVGLLLPQSGLQVDLAAFFVRVTLVVVAPFALAYALRRAIGSARLARNDELLAGANVVLLVVFAILVMNGVTARLLADPRFIGVLFVIACVSTALLHLAGFALFRRAGAAAAYGAALLSGNRNMGLMLAITAGTAGPSFSLYVGVTQIPMYFAPLALTPFVRRSRR